MRRQKDILPLVVTAAILMVVPMKAASPALAENAPANYNFLVASGHLCDMTNSGSCPRSRKQPMETALSSAVQVR